MIGFVVFRSDSTEVAVNVRHLLFWQFLFDPDYGVLEETEDKSGSADTDESEGEDAFGDAGNVNFYLADGARLSFDVDPDDEKYTGEERDGKRAVQFQTLL